MAKTARRRATRKDKVQAGEAPTPRYQKPPINLIPQTAAQEDYVTALRDYDMVVAAGCAGTGKTYVAMTAAAQMYENRQITRIVLTRPNVAAGGSKLGFDPGTQDEKMMAWAIPAVEVLEEHLGKQKVEAMLKCGEIVLVPFEKMRGRSFKDSFVCLDEAQNCSVIEMKMFLTRLGDNCTAVVDGDLQQSDLPRESGLGRICHMVKRQMLPVPIIEFTEDDIVRGDLCAMWIRAFNAEGL